MRREKKWTTEEYEMIQTFFIFYVIIDNFIVEEEETQESYELLLKTMEEMKNIINESTPKV
ncbi:hypothetical protein J4226_02200 [Candidatus Pacearchaeota archaeon]|nr:hypothetical protein [Candidatus Pacearchaeota archaeon]